MNKKRELLFSVTKKDFIIEPFKGSGKGGQHRNKTMSCIRMKHPESGAEVIATEHREQGKNKRLAFRRMVENTTFQAWRKQKASQLLMDKREFERRLEKVMEEALMPENFKTEIYDTKTKQWVEAQVEDLTDESK